MGSGKDSRWEPKNDDWLVWGGFGEPYSLEEIDVVEVKFVGDDDPFKGSVQSLEWDWEVCEEKGLEKISEYRILSSKKKEVDESFEKEMVVKPNHYMRFNVEVDKICQWILNQPENSHLDGWEMAKMCDELEYRLRAGFKTGCFKEDMEKAMNINKNREEYANKTKS